MKRPFTVLVVDDHSNFRDTIVDLFEELGLKCHSASNGHDALNMIAQIKFDLIFLDVRMPELSGIDTFREIKKRTPKTQVVFMTANEIDDQVYAAVREGVVAVIHKPLELRWLRKFLNTYKTIYEEK